ncbi:EF-hand domain-containing protein [Luteolibacter soli]|uniref:EF-hand domain-containing protein n=1 Tax=Luteolibacter soli TaxID=3135280 RepID=A0ABU9ASP5_9BACT
MKFSLALCSVVFASSLLPLSAQEGKVEAVEPADSDPSKPVALPDDESDDGAADEEDDEGTDVGLPEDPESTDGIYTFGGSGPEEDGDIDPVIYQSGVPAGPKVSAKEKRANLQADIVDGCIVTYGAWDGDGNGALDLEEFSAHWPGPVRSHARAFKRIDKDRNGLITASEFSLKKTSPAVMPKAMGILEAAEYRSSFNALDFDGNGYLTFGEFTAVLRPIGPGILEAIFAEADRNGDGKISFAEYTHRPVNVAGVE